VGNCFELRLPVLGIDETIPSYGREGAINPHKEQLRRFQERRALQVELKHTVGVNMPIEERRQGPEVYHKSTGKGRGKRRNIQPLSFHSLRRTATTLLHEAGVPSAVAQALIGHDSEAMHESVGPEALEKATAALPEI
jgi:integrase